MAIIFSIIPTMRVQSPSLNKLHCYKHFYMEEYTIYAENIQSFSKQFYRFLEENPGIAVQSVYSPENENGKNTDKMSLPHIVLTIVYEVNASLDFEHGRVGV